MPRYTSYPTAPQFYPIDEQTARDQLVLCGASEKPLSIYIHIPFCRSMCLFCGCSVVLNRNPERQAAYFELLLKEMELTARLLGKKKRVAQLHLGGGTPTSLTEEQFCQLMRAMHCHFDVEETAECAIEIDPRTVYGGGEGKLGALRQLGFNRVSFGVQDLDPRVQEAVKRRQSEEMTVKTYEHARRLGFHGINIDLIYGLPLQTPDSFAKTAAKLIALRPDRISLFSYAKVPWLKPHQKAISESDLPSDEEKFQMYVETRGAFLRAGYVAIGMDHFALESDLLAAAYREGRLQRNFQGYSVAAADDLLGFGVTSIGFINGTFLQNSKTIEEYEQKLRLDQLPIARGFMLAPEDILRRWVIQQVMCRFCVDKGEFAELFGEPFDAHFYREAGAIQQLVGDGLVENDCAVLRATPMGALYVRLIAHAFDAYFTDAQSGSKSV